VIIPDVNLLLYANISSFALHAAARDWWEAALNADEPIGLPGVSIFGFVRIATNPKIFDPAMSVREATARVEAWLEQPTVTLLAPGPEHLTIAFRLLHDLGSARNLTTDAQFAAHAIENNATLHSNDGDFARFAGLRWVNPLKLG
jgi:uncharacterized protein